MDYLFHEFGWNNFNVRHEFDIPDGQTSFYGLTLASDGNLYGACYAGGVQFGGTFFRINPNSGCSRRFGILIPTQDYHPLVAMQSIWANFMVLPQKGDKIQRAEFIALTLLLRRAIWNFL